MTSPRLRVVAYGPGALDALAEVVGEAKGTDPLAPVTVVPPNVYAGLGLRRAMARRGGVVNTRFMALGRIAELLGAASPALEGRRPLTAPVRAAAVRVALARDPGVLAEVAAHPATARALERTFTELRGVPDGTLDRVGAAGARAGAVVALFRSFSAVVEPHFYDEHDLVRAAARAVRTGGARAAPQSGGHCPALADVGEVVLHLPAHTTEYEPLVSALAEAGLLRAVVGLTGDEEADRATRTRLETLEALLGPATAGGVASPPRARRAVVAPDAGEEGRFVLRDVARRLEGGTPLHRIAVLAPTREPYSRLLHDLFTHAGVPHHSPPVRTLAETVAGRTLLSLLRLPDRDFARRDVLAWLHAAPVLEHVDGGEVPAAAWDRLTREAGVVAGPDQWQRRLAGWERRLDTAPAHDPQGAADPEGERARLEEQRDLVTRLRRFVHELVGHLRAAPQGSWAELSVWAAGLLVRYLGTETQRAAWPDEEHEAFATVEEALASLAGLDAVDPAPRVAAFRRAVEELLGEPAARVGRFGEGVFLAGLDQAAGGDFDVVYVLGMSEGALPSRTADDPLLPDASRVVAGEALAPRAAARGEERRRYLAALAAGGEAVLVAPRADLRGGRARAPSPWFVEAASELAGRRLSTPDLDALAGDHFSAPVCRIQSIEEGLLAARSHPGSPRDRDLLHLIAWSAGGGGVRSEVAGGWDERAQRASVERRTSPAAGLPRADPPLPLLARGFEAVRARAAGEAGPWTGFVGPIGPVVTGAARPLSPTSLEDWALCPFRHFLARVLRVEERDDPQDIERLGALDRGSLVHEVLERFVGEHLDAVGPGEPWSGAARARAREICGEVLTEYEERGRTGRALLWAHDRRHILAETERALDADDEMRARLASRPLAVEMSFGFEGEAPVEVDLGGGRSVSLHGRIDRVDLARDGGGERLVVLDYKTGKHDPYRELDDDVVAGGRRLQLPVYALAARSRFGEGLPVTAQYWFVSDKGGYRRLPEDGEMTGERLDRFLAALGVIVEGVERGVFPARPGDESWDFVRRRDAWAHCRFCKYDRLCRTDRAEVWERVRADGRVGAYRELAGEAGGGDGGGGGDEPR